MFSKKVCHWNAVNVMRNGLLQRGLIVDKLDLGWVVDFDIFGQKPEVIPYSSYNIFLDKMRTPASQDNTDCTVLCGSHDIYQHPQVLLKLATNQPWTWYECNVSSGSSNRNYFALVEVIYGNERIVTVVRANRLRGHPHIGRLLRKNDILKEELPVPPDSVALSSTAVKFWKVNFPRTHPVQILDNQITFLQPRFDKGLDQNKVAEILKRGEIESRITRQEDEIDRSDFALFDMDEFNSIYDPHSPTESLLQQMQSYIRKKSELPCTESYPSLNDLSLDVLVDIISVLDGGHQAVVRSVCTAWNSVVLSTKCTKTVIIQYSRWVDNNKQNPYELMSLLCHCITSATQYVIFATEDIFFPLPLLADLRTFKEMPLTFVFANTTVRSGMFCEETIADGHVDLLNKIRTSFSQMMEPPFARLLLYKVTLQQFFVPACADYVSYKEKNSGLLDLVIVRLAVNVHEEIAFLDVLKRAAPAFPDFNILPHREIFQGLTEWIAEANGNTVRENEILTILKKWQSDDVRFGQHMQWKDMEAKINAGLTNLHPITFWALLALSRTLTKRQEQMLRLTYRYEENVVESNNLHVYGNAANNGMDLDPNSDYLIFNQNRKKEDDLDENSNDLNLDYDNNNLNQNRDGIELDDDDLGEDRDDLELDDDDLGEDRDDLELDDDDLGEDRDDLFLECDDDDLGEDRDDLGLEYHNNDQDDDSDDFGLDDDARLDNIY
ncbi:uncharacterized protein LOC129595095 [Paramacrobiotus metropolitanus]|uniref:uncharacterized protein LOC129595095 n=1 Tax=Paramacrobiotus metropolitanus TaxID=2943436 RepID=UPI002445FC7C|nr:uncharacterized protein LOC129595095 [Paramacrobiotus metropolitanus]